MYVYHCNCCSSRGYALLKALRESTLLWNIWNFNRPPWTICDMETMIWFDVVRPTVQPLYLSYWIRNYHLRRHECATCVTEPDLHRNPILKCKTEFPSLPTFISAWFGFAWRGMIISSFAFRHGYHARDSRFLQPTAHGKCPLSVHTYLFHQCMVLWKTLVSCWKSPLSTTHDFVKTTP